ncbi:MAG: peptidyl-prolyl cis-trans isomerase [Sphaerochaetaceae bacterium]|nr:peptidyl-prolyl cis-trans isomerase [Sphaerochaetaceae bacterium]
MEFRASHILVKDQRKAEELYERAKKGESFQSLAHQYSTCPSKEKGGDLGWFGEGQMVPPFENAVRKMGTGSISKPVRTQFGWHIIKKTGARG